MMGSGKVVKSQDIRRAQKRAIVAAVDETQFLILK